MANDITYGYGQSSPGGFMRSVVRRFGSARPPYDRLDPASQTKKSASSLALFFHAQGEP
jgi:hypothetical protein